MLLLILYFGFIEGDGDSRGLLGLSAVDGENVRIEALAGEEVARRLLNRLVRDYFSHYALVAWVADVAVVRGGKFGSGTLDPGTP